MASFSKFNSFVEALGRKVHNLNADTLKVVLTNSAPTSANTQLSDITQISNGNGYTTGGAAAASNAYAQSSGTGKLTANDVVFTASGSMGPFRYAVLYNDTATNDELIGFWDYGSSITLASGETFTVDFDGTTGILTVGP
jgi:hypothetical protein